MRRNLFGVIAVAAVGVMGLGLTNTGAWFTDQEDATVSASSGKVDISLNGAVASGVTVSNLMPGVETGPYKLEVYNSGSTVPVKYRISTDNLVSNQAAPSALLDVLEVKIVHGFCDGSKPGGVNPTPGGTVTGDAGSITFLSSASISPGGLGINQTHCFALYFSLPSSAGNDYQNTSGTFDIVVDATQLENPGFSE